MRNGETLWVERPILTKSANIRAKTYDNAWNLISDIKDLLEAGNTTLRPSALLQVDGNLYEFRAVVSSSVTTLTPEMEKDILDLLDSTFQDEITLNNSKVGTISRDEVLALKQDDTSRKQWVYVPYLIPHKGDFEEVSNTPDELIKYLNTHLSYNPTGDLEWDSSYFDISVDNAFIRIDSQVYMVCMAVPSYVHMLTLDMQEDIRNLVTQVGGEVFDPDEFFKDYPAVVDMATAKACTSVEEAKALLRRLGLA